MSLSRIFSSTLSSPRLLYTCNGCVFRARKLQFALKIIYKKKCKGREDTIQNEVSILRRIKHRNIVQLIEEFESDSTIYMIMELVTVRYHQFVMKVVEKYI